MLLITGLGATRETGFPKPFGWRTIPYGPHSVGHHTLQRGRASSLGGESTGPTEGGVTPQSHLGVGGWVEGGGGMGTPGWEALRALRGGLCQRPGRVLGGSHHACLIDSLGGREPGSVVKTPSPGLASQTSRCTKKSQSPLSPFSGQSTGRGGCCCLPKAGGSDEAGVLSLLVPSLPSLYASSRENRVLEV